MDGEIAETNLPAAPRGLCFDRLDFAKANFTVDKFLSEHQNVTSLESMRDDLGAYLKVLRLAMIDLINKDYANFVNLSSTLIGFDKSIEKIQVPLTQMNEEILNVKQCFEEAMKELSMWLSQRHALQKQKQLLTHYRDTIKYMNILDKILTNITDKRKNEKITLTIRGAMEYNRLNYSISKCDALLKPEHKTKHKIIGDLLMQTLTDLLFQYWNDNDDDNLLKTLMTLGSLQKEKEIELRIRKQAVAPLLQEIISEPYLQKCKTGLEGVYDEIIDLLNTKLRLLNECMGNPNLVLNRYNFIINCFWCEVESRLEVNLTSIFAPGNPQIFYQRYHETMHFLRRIEEYLNKDTVEMLHETTEYKSFMKRWNLPVYFQIRFQEIAGTFEGTLQNKAIIESNKMFILKQTNACWSALQQCWANGVFIQKLGHKFWKLILQLILRYCTWCCSVCRQKSPSRTDGTTLNIEFVNSSINLYLDSRGLSHKIPEVVQLAFIKFPNEKELFTRSLEPSTQALINVRDQLRKCLVDELYETLISSLRQVSDIPRLYRKTNRSVPSKACGYMDSFGNNLKSFQDAAGRLDREYLINVYEDLFQNLTISYFKYVEDVLTSVQKTEESLRRLKQIREKSSSPSTENSGMSDGEKIRLQLNIDVFAYGKVAASMNVHLDKINKYTELSSMVKDAVKNIEIK